MQDSLLFTRQGLVTIRDMAVSDAPQWAKMQAQLTREHIMARKMSGSVKKAVKYLTSQARDVNAGRRDYLLVEHRGKIVGEAFSLPARDNYRIGLVLLKRVRRLGIGSRCLQMLEQGAYERGVKKMKLSVYVRNLPAICLYIRCGWEPTGKGSADKIEMAKTLVKEQPKGK